MFEENVLISFLRKFDQHPFIVDYREREYQIGEGIPVFRVKFNQNIPLSELTTSTSIALGEAYMDKKLEIDGDLFQALDHFLGQMWKFSTDENALKKLLHTSVSRKNQEREVSSHYDIGNDFYELWLKEGMSLLDIGCGCGWGCLLIEATKKYMEKINLLKTRLQRLNTSEKDNYGVRRKIQKEIRRLEEGR